MHARLAILLQAPLSDFLPAERTEPILEIGSLRKHHAASGEVAYFVDDPRERNRPGPDRISSDRQRVGGCCSTGSRRPAGSGAGLGRKLEAALSVGSNVG